jgi:hypothetical protein
MQTQFVHMMMDMDTLSFNRTEDDIDSWLTNQNTNTHNYKFYSAYFQWWRSGYNQDTQARREGGDFGGLVGEWLGGKG